MGVTELIKDAEKPLIAAFFELDEAKKDKKLLEEELPKFFGHFSRLLEENSSCGVFAGNELTIADIEVYNMACNVKQHKKYDAGAKFPAIAKLTAKVEANPIMKEYLANRKETPY